MSSASLADYVVRTIIVVLFAAGIYAAGAVFLILATLI